LYLFDVRVPKDFGDKFNGEFKSEIEVGNYLTNFDGFLVTTGCTG
jgi:hypothetical protein